MILGHFWRCRIGAGPLPIMAAGIMLLLGLVTVATPARAHDADFATWLRGLRSEALGHGISPATFDAALAHVEPIPRVIELDRKQPEFTLSFAEYLARVAPDSRVERGRELLAENQALLDHIADTYGVQPRFIVALWGVESDFGRLTGDYPVIPALATLAYDGRRSRYFRGELLEALRILELGYIDRDTMRGSWAGAMGQNQFMPSNYLRYAVDYEGKGRRDIWRDQADVFASSANFLLHLGWRRDETWGREARLPVGFDANLADLTIRKPLSEWAKLGVSGGDGGPLPEESLDASLVLPAGADGPAYLVHDNYRALLGWNRSVFFATAVGLLADRIGGR